MAVVIKSPQEIAIMREAGRVLYNCLHGLVPLVKPGVTSLEIDREFEKRVRAAGATPSFKGYQGFPASVCVSVNHELVHGIPNNRRFREGDLVSLDVGLILKGWQADMAITIPVGKIDERKQRLLEIT
ncbi:MAG: M24 family metallopeptidase, partial [Solirubrobacterales bacterium]|nr:M24 family metallopeptidase [Solirubrobacterales bacterium]